MDSAVLKWYEVWKNLPLHLLIMNNVEKTTALCYP